MKNIIVKCGRHQIRNTMMLATLIGLQLGFTQRLFAVSVGQVDLFNDLTTQNWQHGIDGLNAPANISSGGPAGAEDAYLRILSTGISGAGSRFAAFNREQWTGNYISEGILGLTADVNNLGTNSLDLRLAMNGPGGGFASTVPVALGPESGWQSVSFSLAADDMTPVAGNGVPLGTDFNRTFAGVTELRVLSSDNPSWRGKRTQAHLGLDNITAAAANSAGDFNADTLFDLQDLQLLYQQGNLVTGIGTAAGDPFDLDGNLRINNVDLIAWLELAGLQNGYTSPYLQGDTDNLGSVAPAVRTVDITDFNILATHFDPLGNSIAPNTWDRANFDGDTDVDITDFNALATNFSPLGYGASSIGVPEPCCLSWWALAGLVAVVFQRAPRYCCKQKLAV